MPRDNPRRITKQKLLRTTGQQSDGKQIQSALDRHDRMVARMDKAGWKYDPEKGTLQIKVVPKIIHPEDLKDE